MGKKKFLTAEWRKLVMANYEVDSELLKKYLPAGTEPDTWNGKYFISLVGFLFLDTRVMGIKIPFHITFPEVNLRFYVRYKSGSEWKRGVVFINEFVPKPAITFIANKLYKEKYVTYNMKYKWLLGETIHVSYDWRNKKNWNKIEVKAGAKLVDISSGSEEEFITEHYWGYSKIDNLKTGEYQVEHPRWQIYPLEEYTIECDFGDLYGNDFAILNKLKPRSVLLAEGSPVSVFTKKIL